MHEACDLIVLGAGSGGLATALRAAGHGARVVMLDPAPPGGTCLHRGCVPKKALWSAAQLAHAQTLARDYGFDLSPGKLDWDRFRLTRQHYIDGITGRYELRLAEAGVRRVRQTGRLLAADIVEDDRGTRWSAPHVLIATGGRPRRLELPGFELGMVSDDLFTLRSLPRRIAVVGGGYVGVEFAGLLQALGSQVSVFARDCPLTAFDGELVDALLARMRHDGIRFDMPVDVCGARRAGDGIVLDTVQHAELGPYDAVLWAVGRVPNSDMLGLDGLGVVRDQAGHIQVDDFQNTSVPGIYAVGDVTGRRALTPVAVAAGRHLADRLFGENPDARLDYSNIPSVVFADPPLASVGLGEKAARVRHGGDVRIYRSRFTPLAFSVVGREVQSLMKLVCVGEDERVVGIHAMGAGVDEMLQGFAVAMKLGLRKRDLDATVGIHPTSSEELVLMR